MPLAGSMLEFVIKHYKGGKELSGQFNNAFQVAAQELIQAKQQGQNDPKIAIEQQKLQIAQMDSQMKGQQMQLDSQMAQLKAQTENAKLALESGNQQFEHQYKTQELGIRSQESQLKYAIETERLRIEASKIAQNSEIQLVNAEMKALQNKFEQQMQAAYLKLDEFSVVSKENEKLIEEKRLASEERIETLRLVTEQMAKVNETKAAKSSEGEAKTPGVVIHNHIPKQGGKRHIKTKDGWESRDLDSDDSNGNE
jgi:autotransporter translocation and assembly factor TamB